MISIVDTGGANIASVRNAFMRLGQPSEIINTPEAIAKADKIVLPGVSSVKHSMQILKNNGLVDAIRGCKKPVLGICSGMQILFSYSEEGEVEGLGIFEEKVTRLPKEQDLKIPHMGWNDIEVLAKDMEFTKELKNEKPYFYFVHSFFTPVSKYTVASTRYGETISSIVKKDNFYGTQFHPEKSSKNGEAILRGFLNL